MPLLARLSAIDADFALGVTALDRVIRRDGELPARAKSVLLVAAAAVRDRDGLTDEVASALAAGATPDELRSLALALYLSRGAGPCRAVLDAAEQTARTAPEQTARTAPASSPGDAPSATVEQALAEFAAVFGTIPDRVLLLRDHSHDGLEAYHRMRRAVLRSGRLDPMVAELALVCVNAAEHRGDFAAVHARGARLAGATEAQLVEAGLCAVPSGGVAAWLAASDAIVTTRPPDDPIDTSRPPGPR